MIAFAFPWVLGLAVAGALAITALHLLSVRRPPELLLPTARFLPPRDVRAVSRTRRPSDLWLLLLRVALLLAAGIAIAGPHWRSPKRTRLLLVVADRAVEHDTASIRRLVSSDATEQTESATRVVTVFADSGRADADVASLVPLAIRTAARLAREDASIDAIALHLLTRTVPEDSAAYRAWRSAWPGRIVTHTGAPTTRVRRLTVVDADREPGAATRAPAVDDVVLAALAWHTARLSGAVSAPTDTVLVVRDTTAGAGATASIAAASGIRLEWPANAVPQGWVAVRAGDSASALVAGGRALMGPWPVVARPDVTSDAGRDAIAIAWWSDGTVAATERSTREGCARAIAVSIPAGSDALLSPSSNALFDRLLAPCNTRPSIPVAALTMRSVDGDTRAAADVFRMAAGDQDAAEHRSPAWVVAVLLGLSVLLLGGEWIVRARPAAVVP